MRIGIFFPSTEHGSVDDMIERFAAVEARGFASAWLPQSSSHDALTLFAVAGREVPRIDFGTGVIPTFPRHPVALAAQALTTNAATGGRLKLGIGLSHKAAMEGRYGLSYDKPARHMKEYLAILMPILQDRKADFTGETMQAHMELTIPVTGCPPVYLAALQPLMVKLAGRVADGTVTWCTGPITLEEQIAPLITAAAQEAGRPQPKIVVALPCIVTDDEADGREKADRQLAGYGQIPVYRAVLDREGAAGPGDVSVVGNAASVAAQLKRFASIGATEFVAIPCGTPDDRERTLDVLAGL
ncbi:MAG: TIGR03564 family F420-dependent LLM class oxidoreductase [Acidimicrobiia bacterium]